MIKKKVIEIECCDNCRYWHDQDEPPPEAYCARWEDEGLNEPAEDMEACPCWEEVEESEICPDCSGSGEGRTDGSTCPRCHGSGEVPTEYGQALLDEAEDRAAEERYERLKEQGRRRW